MCYTLPYLTEGLSPIIADWENFADRVIFVVEDNSKILTCQMYSRQTVRLRIDLTAKVKYSGNFHTNCVQHENVAVSGINCMVYNLLRFVQLTHWTGTKVRFYIPMHAFHMHTLIPLSSRYGSHV